MAMASTTPRLLHLPAQDGGDRLVITAIKTHVLVVRSYATHAALGPRPSQWHLQLTCRVLHEESYAPAPSNGHTHALARKAVAASLSR